MGNATIAMVFVVVLNMLMWLSQVAVINLNPSGEVFYHCDDSLIESVGGNCTTYNSSVLNSDATDLLPSGQSVQVATSNPFTDIFNNILGWFKNTWGIKYLYQIVSAPSAILSGIGLPSEVAFALGALWYSISIFVVLAFLWGRD